MRSSVVFLLATITSAVNAHFQLQFPPPRGVFNMDNEPTFCDGYLTPAPNRSEFPLSGGFFSLNSEHPQWTAGVLISTLPDPTSFNNFTQVNSFFEVTGEGIFCIPLNLKTSNDSSALQSGMNVTMQIVYDGGDGELYQCADMTLSDTFTIPSSIACTNATGSSNTSSSASSTATSASTTPTKSASLGVAQYSSPASAIVLTFMVVLGTGIVL